MEENRIKELFEPFEIRTLSWKKIADRLKNNFGARFFLNRTEADWLTEEKNKPTKDTLDLIEVIENQKEIKVISINKITEKQKADYTKLVLTKTKSF